MHSSANLELLMPFSGSPQPKVIIAWQKIKCSQVGKEFLHAARLPTASSCHHQSRIQAVKPAHLPVVHTRRVQICPSTSHLKSPLDQGFLTSQVSVKFSTYVPFQLSSRW